MSNRYSNSSTAPVADGLSPWGTNSTSLPQAGAMPERSGILVIDPDRDVHRLTSAWLNRRGLNLATASDAEEALRILALEPSFAAGIAAVFYSLVLPANRGLQFFARLRNALPDVPLYLLVSKEALEAAKAAVQMGAAGYLLKPLVERDLVTLLAPFACEANESDSRSADRIGMNASATVSGSGLGSGTDPLAHLIGRGTSMQRVIGLVRKVAPSDVNVLLTGESGSGKEMVASAIHRCSSRARKPFIAINCAAIPKELLESELFGHARGAFTGANSARRGLFEEAHEGTILLDEIGDLPLPLQAKILRLLQTREVKPLGQNTVKEVNVRIISATHKNLKALIQSGEFREDLYYRLNVMPIHLPPLRERREDIPILAEHFMRKHASSVGKRVVGFTKSAINRLQSLPWKGNVRELENAVERAMVMAENAYVDESDIMIDDPEPSGGGVSMIDEFFNSGMSLKDIEKEYIKHVLLKTGNRKEAATRILGIDRKTLYRKEKLYGIRPLMSGSSFGEQSVRAEPSHSTSDGPGLLI